MSDLLISLVQRRDALLADSKFFADRGMTESATVARCQASGLRQAIALAALAATPDDIATVDNFLGKEALLG